MKADCLVVPMSNSQSIGNCQEICPRSFFSMIPQCGKLIVCRSRTIWESESSQLHFEANAKYPLHNSQMHVPKKVPLESIHGTTGESLQMENINLAVPSTDLRLYIMHQRVPSTLQITAKSCTTICIQQKVTLKVSHGCLEGDPSLE